VYGYTGKILKINLSNLNISTLETMKYTDRFLGGRGIAAKIYWEETTPEIKAFDAENPLVFITGPVTGKRQRVHGNWVCTVSNIVDVYIVKRIDIAANLKREGLKT
jgi:aldehyde:ferredoxin oxidoreductase